MSKILVLHATGTPNKLGFDIFEQERSFGKDKLITVSV